MCVDFLGRGLATHPVQHGDEPNATLETCQYFRYSTCNMSGLLLKYGGCVAKPGSMLANISDIVISTTKKATSTSILYIPTHMNTPKKSKRLVYNLEQMRDKYYICK